MTDEKKRALLRNSTSYRKVTIGGEEYEYCYGPWGRDLAKAQGLDPMDDSLDAFTSFTAQIWSGLLPFQPDLKHEDVSHVLSYEDMLGLKSLIALQNGQGEPSGDEGKRSDVPAVPKPTA